MQARRGSITPSYGSLHEVNCEKKKEKRKVDPDDEELYYRAHKSKAHNCEIILFFSLKVSRFRPRCCCYCCCSRVVSSLAAEARIKKKQSQRPRGRVLAQFTTNRNFKIESHPESPIAQLTEESDDLVDKFVGRELCHCILTRNIERSVEIERRSLMSSCSCIYYHELCLSQQNPPATANVRSNICVDS
ncbi:hypothetical protein ALC53_08004 [Atta colombica]|uniref:Uncharacterized protein n=1 Tax=Atta colombica TaxID=520822 RepID=A0A195BBL7_9HYME|nr:hypothetical protein ALC53_08004 [Atta colombica]